MLIRMLLSLVATLFLSPAFEQDATAQGMTWAASQHDFAPHDPDEGRARIEALSVSQPPAANVNEALERWEAIRSPAAFNDILACASALREIARKGDSVVLQRLVAISTSRLQPWSSREQALIVACELADADGAKMIVDTMKGQMAAIRAAREQWEWNEEVKAKHRDAEALLAAFFRRPARELLGKLSNHLAIHSLAAEVYKGGVRACAARNAAARILADCRVSQDAMDATVAEIVAGSRGAPVPELLIDRLSPGAFPALRELVRSARTPVGFHYTAVSALSHLGDEEILPDLKEMRPTFREHSDSAEKYLLNFIWRVEVQHPPEKLLAFISSPDFGGPDDRRSWAVRRAYKLGVDRDRIREAILAHARDAKTRLERVDLPDLKRLGVELGILKEDDLPGVSTERRGVTP